MARKSMVKGKELCIDTTHIGCFNLRLHLYEFYITQILIIKLAFMPGM